MKSPQEREEALFRAAVELPPGLARQAFLDQACAADAELRQRLEALLAAHELPEAALSTAAAAASIRRDELNESSIERPGRAEPGPPAGGPRPTMKIEPSVPEDEAVGQTIGRYKLLEKVGEGGCGVVYVAEQTEPVRRRVALKVIKLGMDTKQVVARFEAERQALAMMDHPNIAKVLDAGTTEGRARHSVRAGAEPSESGAQGTDAPYLSLGRPYFVMELVRGIKITEYCDQNNLPTKDRLALFIKVCQAIQHAHQKGIIHRDIKPSNILVTLHDGVPVPKVIDFGIAKATEGRLTDNTVYTQLHQFIGTPAYMSPEQAEMSGLDIDTRSDIYSLGVLLYELLTGRTPFDAQELMSQGIDAMRKTIREKDPLRPSTKLATLKGEELTTTAKRRAVESWRLAKLLRGDLDWIVMKCLEKDRTRRYETANGLAADLKRHLNNEPVVARPPSRVYKIQKFARRNKVAFAAVACVTVALVAGFTLATIGFVQARLQRNQALDAQANEARQRQRADELGSQAETQRQLAEEGKRRAELSELAAQQRAYASDINIAQQSLAEGNLGRALEFLDQHRPEPGQPDLRGWEWRYLWQMTRSDSSATLSSEPGWISSIASSPDGRWLAISDGRSFVVRLWDRIRGNVASKLESTGAGTAQAMFSPVNSFLAYTCKLATRTNEHEYGVRVWDTQTQRQIAELPTGMVAGMAFSADERIIITCDYDRTVTRWQLPEGRKVSTNSFKEAPGFKTGGVQFTATRDAGTVILSDYGGNRFAFDLNAGKGLWRHEEAADRSFSLKLSPDDRVLAVGPPYTAGSILLLEVASGRELGRLKGHRNAVLAMEFWPDGKRLASASWDQTIRVWDLHDPAQVPPPQILRGHKTEVWGLALLPDGKTLVSGSKDGEVRLWDAEAPPPESPITRHVVSNSAAWSFAPDSRSLVGVDAEKREFVEWRGAESVGETTTMPLVAGADSECWSRDGRWLAVGATNGWVQVWELPAKILRVEFSTGTNGVVPLQFNQDNRQLALVVGARFEVWELMPTRQSLVRLMPDGLEFGRRNWRNLPFELAPDLSRVFVKTDPAVRKEQKFYLWTPSNDQRLELEIADEVEVTELAYSPDGRLVAATSLSGFTRVLDARTGRIVAKLTGFLNASAGVTFSPDGQRLAVGSGGDGALKLWDVATWRELVTFQTDGNWTTRLRFSPDGSAIGAQVAGIGTSPILQTWRAPSKEEIAAAEAKEKTELKQP